MPQSIGKRWVAILIAVLLLVVSAVTMAFFTDRVDHSMQFTTASFSADGYTLTRTAPEGPFCAGEEVTATLKESNTGDDDVNSIISMKATWVSPDTALSIFGNANAADNAKLSIDGTDISYKVSTDKKSITFDLPKQVLAAGTKDAARDLTLTIPASFKSTGRIEFTFEKVVVAQEGGGFSREYSRTDLNAASDLDYSVKVGWAASSIEAQNGKALMGYLTEKDSVSGKFGIQFEYAFNYNTSPMKDFASKTDAKWSYYKDKADRLTFVEGMTSIGDYAFPDFELVTSLSLPESLVSVGKWSFDNISIPTLTLPAALTNFDTMSFGHINELTEITFNQAAKTDISFPTAGSTTGAFYVDPYVPTKIVGENPIAQGYDWITDQRRVAPVIRSYNYTWSGDRMSQPLDATTLTPDDDSNVDFHTAENRAKIKSVVFQDASGYYAIPDMKPGDAGGLVEKNNNMWDVSAAQNKSVIAWLKDDGTLIIAGDGVKVMANADSDWLFGDMANIETIDATLYDTSNATTMEYWHAFAEPDLRQNEGDWSGDPLPMEVPQRGTKQIVGIQDWDVSKVTSTMDMFYNANRLTSLNLGSWNTKSLKTPNGMFHGCSALTTLDVSGWNTSNVTTLQSIFSHCRGLTALDVAGWDVQKVTDMSFAFSDCGAPVLDLHTWKTNSLTTLEKAFAGAGANTINVTGWNTSKVITMDSAFENTASLGSLDLSTWDTSGVGRGTESDGTVFGTGAFNNMFFRSGAKSINVSGFDFSSLYGPKGNWNGGLYKMFGECKSLTEIVGAETWTNTGKIVELNSTFIDCEKLVTLNVSKWDTSGVTAMSNAFNGCKSLAELDVSKWDVSSCEGYINTFKDCESVKVLDISKWDMTKATPSASQNMFNGCKSLESLTFPTSVNWLATRMAANCPKLTTIEFLSTDASISQRPTAGASLGAFYVAPDAGVTVPVTTFIITHGSGMAQLKDASIYNWADDNRCFPKPTLAAQNTWYKGTTAKNIVTEIEIVDSYSGASTESWDASAAQDGSVMGYINGTKLIIAGNGYGKVLANADSTSAFNAFTNVTSFTGLNKLDTSNVTNMQTMFNNLDNIQTLDLSSFNTSKVTNFYSIFGGNDKLTTLNLTGWDTSAAKDMGQMFYVCNALTTINGLSSFNTANVTDMSGMFHGCKAMTSLDLSNFNTAKVKTLSMMFYQCSNLETVKLTSFDTSNVTSLYAMFQYCYKLKTADLSSFNTAKVTNMRSMFGSCEAVENLDLSSFDTSAVTNMYAAFDGCHKLQEITLGKAFKFVGTDGYLPTPSSTYIPQADGNWYVKGLTKHYTPAELAAVTRVRAVTYSAIPGTDPGTGGGSGGGGGTLEGEVRWPVQSGSLTYNGNTQSPSWSGYDSSKMTIGGTTSGTNAGTYTATFTPKDGYCWPDGTADTVKVTWKIGKAAGSLSLSPTTLTIDASSTTGTITVTRAGDGAITAKSSNTNIATVSVDGNKITVTKKGDGTATITVSVAESANYLAPSDKTSNVKCESVPTLAANSSWYKGTTAKSAITAIEIKDSYTPTGTVTEQWNADVDNSGSIKAYVEGTKLTIAGNGAGKIMANADSGSAFDGFSAATSISGLNLLDTSNVTNMRSMFAGCKALTSVGDISGWNTANVTDMQEMFNNCWALKSLNLSGWNTANVTDMFSMFYFCNTLTSLDVSGWNTSNVTCMSFMFANCPALASLDLSGFDTSKVTLMADMFDGCTALTSVGDLSGWNTANVTNMKSMFEGCSSLTGLDLSGWDTSNVTTMEYMFSSCKALTNLNLSSFDTSKVGTYDMYNMFSGCRVLQTVTLGKNFKFGSTSSYLPTPSSTYITGANGKWYDTSDGTWYTPAELASVTRTEARTYVAVKPAPTLAAGYSWYKGSTAKSTITAIEIKDSYTPSGTPTESWNADVDNSGSIKAYVEGTKLTIAGNGAGKIMANADSTSAFSCDIYAYEPDPFASVTAISGLDKLDTSNVTDMATMFLGCSSLTSLDLSGFNTSKVTNMGNMFGGCSSLTSLDLSGFDTSKVTNMGSMFGSCEALTSLDVSGWNTSNVTNMQQMFYYCKAMVSLDLSGWNTSNVTTMQSMFWCCSKLTSVGDLSGWNTANVTDMEYMFNYCEALTSLDLSGWNTSNVTTMRQMFRNCKALTSVGDLSGWDTSNVTNMYFMFEDCNALTSVGDLSGWNTFKVTDMSGMFFRCYKLTSLDLSGWDTSNVTDMGTMFYNCTALTGVGNLSGWDTSNVTDMQQMFDGCNALTSLDVSGWNTSNVTTMQQMFENCKAMVSLDISGWDTSNVTIMYMMFSDCTALTKIYASDLWSTAGVTNARDMFLGCSKLSGAISYNSSKVDATYANYTTGYLTYKAAPARSMSIMSNGNEISGYSISE